VVEVAEVLFDVDEEEVDVVTTVVEELFEC
jgi:hypothetical protein